MHFRDFQEIELYPRCLYEVRNGHKGRISRNWRNERNRRISRDRCNGRIGRK